MLRFLLLVFLSVSASAQKLTVTSQSSSALLTWTASPSGGTVNVLRAPVACASNPVFSQIASGVVAAGPYTDTGLVPGHYCYQTVAVVDGVPSGPSNTADLAVFPSSPVDVFRFAAPSNVGVSSSTAYFLGSLAALGHHPDMVYLAPNACILNKVIYDTRASGALAAPVTISMWDVTQNIVIPGSAVTQTWTGSSVETVVAPGFAVAANDQLQVRFSMPAGVPAGFYLNMTVTAYCQDD